jgi:hypothetical protein
MKYKIPVVEIPAYIMTEMPGNGFHLAGNRGVLLGQVGVTSARLHHQKTQPVPVC